MWMYNTVYYAGESPQNELCVIAPTPRVEGGQSGSCPWAAYHGVALDPVG